MKNIHPAQLDLLDPSIGLPEPGVLGLSQQPIAAWEELEIRRLMDRLCAVAGRRRKRAEFIVEFSFTDIQRVAREARAFVHLLDGQGRTDSSSCSALGIALRKHIGRVIPLSNGSRAVLIYGGTHSRRRRDEMYRLACGRDVDADTATDSANVLKLVAHLADRAQQREATVDHRREVHDFRKNEIRQAALDCGAFSWLDLNSPSGQARLGLCLAAFNGQNATDGLAVVTLRASSGLGRQKRWRLRFIDRG
jgi:hypothetical protein